MEEYWNHNSAYHGRILRVAERLGGRVLDVGCGEGLLVQRLAPVSEHVTGIDTDTAALATAKTRTTGRGNVTLVSADFLTAETAELEPESFDLVVFVAVIHHMDLTAALAKARTLLRPGGELFAVGLSANKTALDWVVSGLVLPVVRVLGLLYREWSPPLVTAEPREDLARIRAVAQRTIPGARIRRGLYYRYLLRWRRPRAAAGDTTAAARRSSERP
ncbi:MAG: class I SAM-dependent methyltransferase [Nocardiopsaceae bacterium]|nr:class I SAM-dependent methyltransferase [Nocardiopsaceae bacterium]